jgi:hypothetical protein
VTAQLQLINNNNNNIIIIRNGGIEFTLGPEEGDTAVL